MAGTNPARLAESYCDWWSLAGVDALVGETPAPWLAPPTIANDPAPAKKAQVHAVDPPAPLHEALRRPEPVAAPTQTGPVELPQDWADFRLWLAEHPDVPGAQWDARRVLPVGEAGSPLVVITAWPEMEDQSAGELFFGDTGKLLDAMLRAIGLDRSQCFLSSLAITRPPGGRCSDQEAADLDRLLRHQLRLLAPERVILMGGDMARMAAQVSLTEARGKLLNVNHDGGKVDAIAIAHPATLLARPAQKAAAWDSLKQFNRGR